MSDDYGLVYFYNMTNQSLKVLVNDQSETEPLIMKPVKFASIPVTPGSDSAGASSKKKEKQYIFDSKTILRNADPAPGGTTNAFFGLNNKIRYWLADDRTGTRLVEIDIDHNQPGYHTNADFLVYIFYDHVILSVDGNAEVHASEVIEPEEG